MSIEAGIDTENVFLDRVRRLSTKTGNTIGGLCIMFAGLITAGTANQVVERNSLLDEMQSATPGENLYRIADLKQRIIGHEETIAAFTALDTVCVTAGVSFVIAGIAVGSIANRLKTQDEPHY